MSRRSRAHRFASWTRRVVFCLATLLFVAGSPTPAADRTWDGGGANDNWSTPLNWDGNLTAPVSGDSLTFDGLLRLTPNNDLAVDSVFGPVTFAPSAGSFAIGGNRITLGGNIVNASANAQTINLPILLSDNRTIQLDSAALTLGGVVSGATFGITKTGAGLLTLAAANTYTGATIIDGGTLAYSVNNPNVAAIAFGTAPVVTPTPSASANTGALDLTTANVTATSLTVQTNSATPNLVTIGAGRTFTVNGGVTVGPSTAYNEVVGGVNTALAVEGNSFVVNGSTNHFVVGVGRSNASTTPGADPIASLDMANLSSFSYTATTGEFRVGGGNVRATARLANAANTITAAAIRVGDTNVSGTGNNNSGRSFIHLGNGTNILNVNNLFLGEGKSGGVLDFAADAPDGSITIAGLAGGTSTANLQLGSSSSGTGSGDESQLNLAGHNATVQAGNVVLGRLAGATGGNSARGAITFDTGTFSANSIQLGVNSSGSAANGATGTLTLGGPNPGNTSSTAVLNVASQFFLANRTNSNAAAGRSTGTFTINGGTANVNTDILDASTTTASAGTNLTTLTLDGGTLNMAGHNIGTLAAPINTINLNSGTLNNPGTIAGRNITLNNTVVTVNGSPTYLIAENGNLIPSAPLTLPSGSAIGGGGPAGPGIVVGDVTAASGSRLTPGSDTTAGTLNFTNNLTLNDGATARFKLSDNPSGANDLITVNGNLTLTGKVNVDIASLGSGPQIGNTYTLFNYSGTLTGNQTNVNVAGFGSRTTFTVVPTATTPNQIQVTVTGSGPLSLTWTGNQNNNWDVNQSTNWRDAASTPQKFFNQDTVTFDNTSTNLNDVQIVGQVLPANVTVSATRDYRFVGAGGIGGGASLTKDLAGTLVLATDNTYTGATNILAGTLQVGDNGPTGSLGTGDVTDNGTLVFKRTGAVSVPGVISGTGAVRQDAAGTLTLAGANSFAGGLTVNAGAVRLNNATAAGTGTLTVNAGATAVTSGALTNPIVLTGATFGTSATPLTFTGDVTVNPSATASTIRLADPLNLPTVNGDVNEVILTGNLLGSGNLTVLSNGRDNNADGGNGFRLRGTGTSTYSGTITIGNNVKGELQSTTAGAFSPAGTGKVVVTAGDATLGTALTTVTTTGGYSELNLRNNTTGDITFGNDIAVTGTGLAVLNPLGSAPVGAKTTMGNLSIGAGQELGVYLAANANRHVVVFPTVTLNGTATISPKKPGFGADNSTGSDVSLGIVSELTPGSGLTMGGLLSLAVTGNSSYTGPTTVNAGTLQVTGSIASSSGVTVNAGATFDAAAKQSVRALTVNAGGMAVVSTGTLKVGDNTTVTPLVTSGTGAVDLKANALVVDYATGGDAVAMQQVRGQIVSGYAGGSWQGSGITSSVAAATSGDAVGYAYASDVLGGGGGTFLGQSVDGNAILVRHTLFGDSNLDGAVNFVDLVALAQHYNTTVAGTTESWWSNGDFTYDGVVDFNDLVRLAQLYNSALPAGPVPGAPANFGSDLAAAFAAVPEPSIGFVGLAASGLAALGRRRR